MKNTGECLVCFLFFHVSLYVEKIVESVSSKARKIDAVRMWKIVSISEGCCLAQLLLPIHTYQMVGIFGLTLQEETSYVGKSLLNYMKNYGIFKGGHG